MGKKPCVHDKVLVVGTTSDYIDWIQKAYPDRALFLTEPEIRELAKECSPDPEDEIVSGFNDATLLNKAVKNHLKKWNQKITGVVCFDCESMETASMLAAEYGADYPDIQSIKNCRDKYISKQIWEENGVRCPSVCPVNSAEDAANFLTQCQKGIVLKPFCGSGSELVFHCRSQVECIRAFGTLKAGLEKRRQNRLFDHLFSEKYQMLAEAYIEGPEYSCDFIIDHKEVRILRFSKKIKYRKQPFGTASGYILFPALPDNLSRTGFETMLLNAGRSLGIKRAVCMVDFIMDGQTPAIIEITPRPGGDCIPFLIKEATGLDILGLTMDFAERKALAGKGASSFKPHIGLRIHADRPGVFNGFSTDLSTDDNRVKQIHIIRRPGHKITMPPEDYDSWLLGHIIIEPDNITYPETQSILIRQRLKMEIQ